MYYLVSENHDIAAHLTRSNCEGFYEVRVSNAVIGTDDMLWNGAEEDGNVRSECEKDEGTDCADGDGDTDW